MRFAGRFDAPPGPRPPQPHLMFQLLRSRNINIRLKRNIVFKDITRLFETKETLSFKIWKYQALHNNRAAILFVPRRLRQINLLNVRVCLASDCFDENSRNKFDKLIGGFVDGRLLVNSDCMWTQHFQWSCEHVQDRIPISFPTLRASSPRSLPSAFSSAQES